MADPDALDAARFEAADIVAAARVEAAALLEDAEGRARERADAVIAQYQERLDALLDEERSVRARLDELGESPSSAGVAGSDDSDLVDDRDLVNGIDVSPDSSLADFMKETLRDEMHPTNE